MAKINRPGPITAADLQKIALERSDQQEQNKHVQRFLDLTNTNLDLDRVSEQELSSIRSVVEDPASALSGPNLLVWNNICRQRPCSSRWIPLP